MSEQEPWQRRVRRPDGSLDPAGHAPSHASSPVNDAVRPIPDAPRGRRPRDDWRAAASFGPLIGATVVVVLFVIGLIGIWQARSASGSDRILWLLVAGIGLAGAIGTGYLLSSIATIRYVLGDDSLTVRWRHNAHVIPYSAIDEVVYDPRQAASGRGWELFWPGFYAYSRRMSSRTLRVVATLDARRRVAILTSGEAVELSPERPVLFLGELDRRRFGAARAIEPQPEPQRDVPGYQPRAAPVAQSHRPPHRRPPPSADPRFRPRSSQQVPARVAPELPSADERGDGNIASGSVIQPTAQAPIRSRPADGRFATLIWLRDQFREQLLGDQVSSTLLAVGVIIPVLMVAFLYNQSAGLPDQIPLHWDALGSVDKVGEPRDLWRLPLLALVLLIGNTAVATLLIGVDRFLTRLLLAATPIAQTIAFIALLRAAL